MPHDVRIGYFLRVDSRPVEKNRCKVLISFVVRNIQNLCTPVIVFTLLTLTANVKFSRDATRFHKLTRSDVDFRYRENKADSGVQ